MNEFLNFFLDEAVDILIGWEKTSLRLEQDSSAETKDELYRAAHNLKSGSGAVGLEAFHHLVHAVEDLISMIMGDEGPVAAAAVRIFLDTHSTLAAWVDRLRVGDETIPSAEIAHIMGLLEPFRKADGGGTIDEGAEAHSEPVPASAPELSLVVKEPMPADDAKKAAPHNPIKAQETIRVAANKLDNLIELVGELATQQAIVWHGRQLGSLDSENCDNAIQLIQKIAKDLQALSLSLRLQPLQGLFQRLERTIRDLARSQEKSIDIVLKGEDVELDKSVAERIADALTHIVRNAMDHGVENGNERRAAGKAEKATIVLEALPAANGVVIKITDDGRGLNSERIRKKAIERGLIPANAQLPESDIQRLIFHAGLSTAEKITDISGRGVGMDVVKTSVENIGGNIQLSSVMGKGTTFSIALPATLSIVDALLIETDARLFAIPLQDVAEIIDLNEVEIQAMPGSKYLLKLRNSVVPLEDLRLHLPSSLKADDRKNGLHKDAYSMQPAILVRSGDSLLAFRVDAVAGQQLITVRALPAVIAHIPGYTGGTILGDGNPCVVLNLVALASRHFEDIHRGASSVSSQPLTPQSRFEESDIRYLIMQSGSFTFATSLMMVREILEDIHCEKLLGQAEMQGRYIAVRGELIPVCDLDGFTEICSTENKTFVVTSDGRKAFGVDRVLAVSTLESVPSHREEALDDVVGVVGFRRFENTYIPLIDIHQVLHLQSTPLAEGRNVS